MNGCYMLIDGGANAECRPEMLQQFGIMGSAYMEKVLNIKEPSVGIINIGTEENKGLPLQIEASRLLKASPVRFIGNVEARELPLGRCDVAVCDGFTGNVVLKLTEGMGKWISAELKKIFLKNAGTKIAALIIKDGVDGFRKSMDYTEHGGAPLLGLTRPVIKAHGSSNAHAFKNAIRQAKTMVENGVIDLIVESLKAVRAEGAAGEE
jgi:glycerol-3-phosphate acyltransferase PlsX